MFLAHLAAARRVTAFSLPNQASALLRSSGSSSKSTTSQRALSRMASDGAIKNVVVIVAMEGTTFNYVLLYVHTERRPVGVTTRLGDSSHALEMSCTRPARRLMVSGAILIVQTCCHSSLRDLGIDRFTSVCCCCTRRICRCRMIRSTSTYDVLFPDIARL